MLADMFSMIGMVSPDQQFYSANKYLLKGSQVNNLNKNDMNKLEKLVLKESIEEESRSGGWNKIFPSETALRYKPFFDVDRNLNRLLRE